MKKLYISVISVLILFSAAGCKKNDILSDGRLKIVASFYPVYIIAKNVTDGVKDAEVINMTPPITGCLHDYSVTSEDMKRLEKASIFLINGAGMETFLDKIIKKYPALKIAELSKGIDLIHGEEDDNPHVWVSITNAVIMTENCGKTLSEIDPKNADQYKKNTEKYAGELNALAKEMKSKLEKYRGRKIITFHEAFPYFAREFGLKIAAVIEREPGSEPSAKELAKTIKIVKMEKIKTLFAEPQYPSLAAETIAKETGGKVYVLDPAVTGEDDKNAYINIMSKNLSVLVKAFE